jgi:hypothetical protein
LESSGNKLKKVWQQPNIVTTAISSEMIKSIHSLLAKLCILFIISDYIVFVTPRWGCHTFGLKLDEKSSNPMKTFVAILGVL